MPNFIFSILLTSKFTEYYILFSKTPVASFDWPQGRERTNCLCDVDIPRHKSTRKEKLVWEFLGRLEVFHAVYPTATVIPVWPDPTRT